MLDTYLKWLEGHEKLLLVAVAGVVLWFGIGKVQSLIAAHDNAALQQAQIVANQNAAQTAAVAQQVAQQASQYQALAAKVQQQNDALMQANVALSTALAKQQKTDATLPPSDLVARLNTLVPQAGATVTPSGVALPAQGAVAVTQSLEQVPVLQTELSNSNKMLVNADTLLTASQGQVVTLNSEITGLRTQIVDNDKVCQAQIAVVKADARKSKRRWFYAGVVIGFIGRQLIKTETGF
jgi:hypothetical protein